MEPDKSEKNSQETAYLIRFILNYRKENVPQWIKFASENSYGDVGRLNDLVVWLCDLCTHMEKWEQDEIIYNGRNADSRRLANWWDEHQKADEVRLKKETVEAERKQTLRASGLAKLTRDEQEALDIK